MEDVMPVRQRRRSGRSHVARIIGQFREMPGLCVTVAEASRLWGMDLARCMRLIQRLVAIGVLRPISRGRYVCAA